MEEENYICTQDMFYLGGFVIHKSGKWYFVTKIVLTYCEKKIVLVIKKNF